MSEGAPLPTASPAPAAMTKARRSRMFSRSTAAVATTAQGLKLAHFSAQLERF